MAVVAVVVVVVDVVVLLVVEGAVVVVVDAKVAVVVVVVEVVPPLTHRLGSLRLSPGKDGPSRMSPGCLLWPFVQPLMLIEMTT